MAIWPASRASAEATSKRRKKADASTVNISGSWFQKWLNEPRANLNVRPSRSTKRGGAAPATASPIGVTATPAAAAAASNAAAAGSGRRDDEFVIVAAAGGDRKQARIGADRRAGGGRQRQPSHLDRRGHAADPEHLGQVADEAVGDVHPGAGEARHRRRQSEPRLRQEITVEQTEAVRVGERRPLPEPQAQAERGVADRAGDVKPVAGADAAARGEAPGLDRADGGDRQRQRTRRPDGVAADQRTAIGRRVVAEAGGEGCEPVRRPVVGQREIEREADRLGALGGEVGQIDPQRLARDRVGRIVGEEMDAGDQRVGGDDEIAARRRLQQRDVVLQPEPGRAGERREIARDQFVFAGTVGHGRRS